MVIDRPSMNRGDEVAFVLDCSPTGYGFWFGDPKDDDTEDDDRRIGRPVRMRVLLSEDAQPAQLVHSFLGQDTSCVTALAKEGL